MHCVMMNSWFDRSEKHTSRFHLGTLYFTPAINCKNLSFIGEASVCSNVYDYKETASLSIFQFRPQRTQLSPAPPFAIIQARHVTIHGECSFMNQNNILIGILNDYLCSTFTNSQPIRELLDAHFSTSDLKEVSESFSIKFHCK